MRISKNSIDVNVGGSILSIVPAVHFEVAFAEAVNELCCARGRQPDAIAVELTPHVAQEASAWMRELGVGSHRRVRLPCMLGISWRNRWIRAAHRERAEALQLETGHELHDLPAEVLSRELGFYPHRLVMLSPTDSIVEALRSACELELPVHGVDLEEHGDVEGRPVLTPDAAEAQGRPMAYVQENEMSVAVDPDPSVNGRRELVMAARLKMLLVRHRRVLFTCGMGHWRRVVNLVRDRSVRPACELPPSQTETAYRRVLVDPSLACQAIDRIPLTARVYERWRRHPRLDGARARECVELGRLVDTKIRQITRRYVRRHAELGGRHVSAAEAVAIGGFPDTLAHFARFRLREVPDIGRIYACARVFVGTRYATALREALLDFPWANAADHPGCHVVKPDDVRAANLTRSLDEEEHDQRPSGLHVDLDERDSHAFTWSTWETLCTVLSDEARGRVSRSPRVAEAMQRSFEDGLALRATLRARARGDDSLYVWTRESDSAGEVVEPTEGWPVVWIFDSGAAGDSRWHNYLVPLSWLLRHARDPAEFARRYAGAASNLSALIGFGGRGEFIPGNGAIGLGVSSVGLRGLIVFSPVFSANLQYCRWIELTRGTHNPLYRRTSVADLPDTIVERLAGTLGLAPGRLAWQDDLVRMALLYAEDHVTVVAPRTLRLGERVYRDARRLNRRIAVTRLEGFRRTEVARLRSLITAPGIAAAEGGATVYVEGLEELIDGPRAMEHKARRSTWQSFGR